MKTLMAIFLTLTLITGFGCQSTKASKQGGISPVDEQFSIVVPTSTVITQGAEITADVSLKRGAYFKQDVKLEIESKGISVTPTSILVKASDLPNVALRVKADENAALGKYSVSVKGTPTLGEPTSIAFTVEVKAPEVIQSSGGAVK